METYTLEQIKTVHAEQKYRHCGLFDLDNKELIPFNPNTKPFKERFDEITRKLKSPTNQGKYFVVKCKHNIRKTAPSDNYSVFTGEVKEGESPPPPQITNNYMSENPRDNVLSYEKALEYQTKIVQLEAEVKRLTDLVADQDAIIEELESESEKAGLGEEKPPVLSFFESLSESVIPVLDRFFDVKQDEQQLRTTEALIKMGYRPDGTPISLPPQGAMPPTMQTPPESNNEINTEGMSEHQKFLHDLAVLAQTDPEEYERVVTQMQNQNERPEG